MDNKLQLTPLSNMEVASFCGQMAMILQSGISSLEGISIMMEDSKSREEQKILTKILEHFQKCGIFYLALKESGVFPEYMLHMVNIGEETGKLDEVMKALAAHYEREDAIVKSIKNAVTYPLVMVAMMIIVILVLMIKVMPIFNQVFIQLGHEMTGFSKGVLNTGIALSRYSAVFIGLVAVIIGLILYFTKTKSGKAAFMKIGYKFRFTREIYEGMAACRFASGMALTLSSGLNTDQGLELVGNLIDNPVYKKKVDALKTMSEEGGSFNEGLASSHVLSGMYARMASIGIKTGSLDEVMSKIAEQYEEEIDNRINNILAVLEPTLVIALSLIVGAILLSVMLPLLGIMSSI